MLAGENFPAEPSQARSRRARDHVLAAALSRFAENGFEATTVDEITKQAGVAVGGFYLHFRSKRQALLVLMGRLLDELDGCPIVGRSDETNLIEHLRICLENDWSHAGAYRAWREAALRDASLALLHAQIERWTTARIAAALRAAETAPTAARRHVDVDAFAWILSVLFWRSIEAPVAERQAVATTIVAFVQDTLFEAGGLNGEAP